MKKPTSRWQLVRKLRRNLLPEWAYSHLKVGRTYELRRLYPAKLNGASFDIYALYLHGKEWVYLHEDWLKAHFKAK